MRRERERKAGNAHHPTQDQGQAGRRFAQQEESIPPEPKLPPKQSQSAKPSARCRPHISKKVYVRCQPEQAQVEGRPSNRQELCSSGQFVVGQSRQGASTESAIATLLNSSPDLLQTTLQSSNDLAISSYPYNRHNKGQTGHCHFAISSCHYNHSLSSL